MNAEELIKIADKLVRVRATWRGAWWAYCPSAGGFNERTAQV